MHGFLYTITLQEPVLANSLGGDPNSANSLYYIPGGLVRGAAINAYTGDKEAGDDTFRSMFLDGQTRFLNAYPLTVKGHRSLPTPLKFKKPKYFDGSDLSIIEGDQIIALEEEWQVNVHTQRDAKLGHAAEGAGAVYRYISLPAGFCLQGAVLAESQTDADEIEKLLNGKSILLGKARTAGYGHAMVTTEPLGNWNEGGLLPTANVTSFTLTLLSPTIVRNEYGQPTSDINHALKTRLGVDTVTIKEAWQKEEIVGGFNRKWGLPLPQVAAIAAGSHFEIEASVDKANLESLQTNGLGKRRAEGFGRVAVNLSLPSKVEEDDWRVIEPKILNLALTKNNLQENKTALLMTKRLLRRDLDGIIIHAARQMTDEYKGNVPNSQLSRWRVIVRDVLGRGAGNDNFDMERLQKLCQNSKGKSGWVKMEKARVMFGESRPRLTEWIEKMVTEPDYLYDSPGLKPDLQRSLSANSSTAKEMNNEYRLRLLDAVLTVMTKKNGGRNG